MNVVRTHRSEPTPEPAPRPTAAPKPRPTPRPTIAPTPSVAEATHAPTALRVRSGYATTEADDAVMAPKEHGTCPAPVQAKLRWGCDRDLADDICCFNRHYAEPVGYAFDSTSWPGDVTEAPQDYYDPVSGIPLFRAPVGRSRADFLAESRAHGWPSFRDAEVYWDNVRVLANGETVSIDGTHLGHNLPDAKGNRYCISLVSIAGRPDATD